MFSRRELSLLHGLYEHGTLTAASAAIGMTQPAASALLRNLEVRLGFALFSREHRQLRLTSQGRQLLPEVLHAVAALQSAERLAGDIRQGAMTRLVIGAVAIAATSLLPPALAVVRRAHPAVVVTVRAGTALEITEMVRDHRVELGVVIGSPADSRQVQAQPLAPLALHAVLPPGHAWAARTDVTLAEVAQAGPIVLAEALPAGLATRRALQARGLPYQPRLEVAQSSSACALAAEGLGVAIVESLGAYHARRQGLVTLPLLVLEEPVLALLWARERALTTAAQTLCEALVTQAATLLPAAP